MKSAYRKHHSTETALLKVTNDILRSLDVHRDVILVMLDLSAAFDTIDHDIMLNTLSSYFGFSGKVLQWFDSYLRNRSQSVIIDNTVSQPQPLEYGVPQGSILGPLLFTLYTAPLQDIISAYKLESMFYADDSQLYIAINPKEQPAQLNTLRQCIEDVISWNTENKLLCNSSKTEVIYFSSRFSKNSTEIPQDFSFANTSVKITDKVKDLGMILDSKLTLTKHINDICKKTAHTIRNIGRIRKYLSTDNLKRLVNASVSSRLDYCNSMFFGLPKCHLDKLQRLQNTSARLITGSKRLNHITPVLKELHWLPVEYRIKFKILLLTFKIINGYSPCYLSSLINRSNPNRIHRSAYQYLLQIPLVKTSTYGQRAFSYSAPKLWNSLPVHIKNSKSITTFKKELKTFYFKECFS